MYATAVNSVSLDFIPAEKSEQTAVPEQRKETAYFAGGCFWGVEYMLKKLKGVESVRSGYMGRYDCQSDLPAGLQPHDRPCRGRWRLFSIQLWSRTKR